MIQIKFYFTIFVIITVCTATRILADYKSSEVINELEKLKNVEQKNKNEKDSHTSSIIDTTHSKQKVKNNNIKSQLKLTPKQKEKMLIFQKKMNSPIVTQGQCGDNAFWILQENGTLTILGESKIDEYYENGTNTINRPRLWDEYRADIKNIIIENGITWVGMHAFYKLYRLENIQIARSVQGISWNAFGKCDSLKKLRLPNSLEFFHSPGKELEIEIEGGLDSVSKGKCGLNANFKFNKKKGELIIYGAGNMTPWQSKWTLYKNLIKKVYIADKISSIGHDSFTFCKNLESIRMSNNITLIGDWAFNGCVSLKSIILPKNLKSIGRWAFSGCTSLSKVRIPNKVTKIGEYVFSACNNIIVEAPIHLKGKMQENDNVTIRYYH